MVIHTMENENNHSLLEGGMCKPPLHWIRPVVMKNYRGRTIVKGIAEKKGMSHVDK